MLYFAYSVLLFYHQKSNADQSKATQGSIIILDDDDDDDDNDLINLRYGMSVVYDTDCSTSHLQQQNIMLLLLSSK